MLPETKRKKKFRLNRINALTVFLTEVCHLFVALIPLKLIQPNHYYYYYDNYYYYY